MTDRLLKTRSWRALWMTTAAAGAVGAVSWGLEVPAVHSSFTGLIAGVGALGLEGPAAHWAVTGLIAGVGALIGGIAPFILLRAIRGLVWVLGAAVQVSAAFAVGAVILGAVGATVYAVILALA